MDDEDWKEFAAILDRRAVANSYLNFYVVVCDGAQAMARKIEEMVWQTLIKEINEKPNTS